MIDAVTPHPTATHVEVDRKPGRPSRPMRWLNGGVHWITAAVLLYAFISNGETTVAMINPVAMRGEVRLGLVVGVLFLFRFVWVRYRRSGEGRWAGSSVQLPRATIRRLTDWGIYLAIAATVASGLLIAYLRPGAVIQPGRRGFLTDRPSLNAAIIFHVHVTTVLEWLCVFHAVYATWYWRVRRSRWGAVAEGWLERVASAGGRVGVPRFVLRSFTDRSTELQQPRCRRTPQAARR